MPGVPSSSGSGTPAPCARPGGAVVPQLPGFPGLPGSVGGSAPSSPTDCVTPLAGLMTCGTFLTGSEPETPTPQSECCAGLGAFLNISSSAAEGDDHTLRCLCPVILGDVNKMLPKPVDPVRMMYLPIACGVVLPPQVLYICFSESSSSLALSSIDRFFHGCWLLHDSVDEHYVTDRPLHCMMLPWMDAAGQQSPPLVGRIPDVWEKPTSGKEYSVS